MLRSRLDKSLQNSSERLQPSDTPCRQVNITHFLLEHSKSISISEILIGVKGASALRLTNERESSMRLSDTMRERERESYCVARDGCSLSVVTKNSLR